MHTQVSIGPTTQETEGDRYDGSDKTQQVVKYQ